jgi:glycosyltransferase involved in cell wall biosynthesis
MHIAILIGRFPPGVVGGAEIQAQAWAKRLATRHRVTVVTRLDGAGQAPREQRDGFTVIRLPVAPLPIWRAAADMAGIERTLAALSPRPDVLLCFMTFLSGLAGVLAGRRLGIPAVVWVRGEAEYRLSGPRLERFISPRVWKEARGVLVQSEWNRSELLRELEQASPETASRVRPKLEVVPNGLQLPEGPFLPGGRVLTVCRLIANKGVRDLVAACAQARQPLTVAGDGPERPGLESLARALGADVRFEGFVDRAGLDTLYREASAFVLASHRGEGLPNAVLEAMSYARPVIVTPSGATRDLVRDGYNGLLVDSADRHALADALRRLQAEPGYAAALGIRARGTVERFAWDTVYARLEDALERWAVKPRGRVCFYSPHLYPVVSGGRALATGGGGEVQLTLIAKGLVRRGFEVDVVTCDYGQKSVEVKGGVRLLRCWRPGAGWPLLRFFHPRWASTLAALRRSGADVYVVKGAGPGSGFTCDVAHALGKTFVFLAGQDLDVTAGLPRARGPRERWWARRGLLGADAVIVQTERQRELLRTGFALESTVITRTVLLPAESADAGTNGIVLWVGVYQASKRPEWFLRFAERHPELRCAMAGVIPSAPRPEREYARALAAAARLPNLEVSGPVAHERIGEFYAGGALLAHTSPHEGIPNTFLEAWSHGLPAITAFDPDGVIQREGIGESHETYEAWEAAIVRWMADPVARREAGLRARTHVTHEHALYRVADRYAVLLDGLIERARPESAPAPAGPGSPRAQVLPPAGPVAPGARTAPARRRRAVRVAFLQATLGVGGAERLVQALIRRMRPGLVTPVAITLYAPGPIGEELIAEDRTVVSRLASSRYDSQVGRRLRAVLDAHAIDVVYVFDSPLPKFWMGVLRRQSVRPRVVLGFHSTGNQGHAVQHFMSKVALVPVVDRQVALSETHRQYLAGALKLEASKLDVIGTGVDLDRFHDRTPRAQARERAGLPAGAPLVGIVAALRPEKNHAMFLRSALAVAQRVPEARFFVAGDGPERGTIERLRRELGLVDRVLMLGSRSDIADLFRAADVAVLSSHSLVETLPITLMEAAACGTPIVATDVGSVRDIVVDGENGYLVPPGDEAAFAARIAELLADLPLRERMGGAGREFARSHFDERDMIRKYERLFLDAAQIDE